MGKRGPPPKGAAYHIAHGYYRPSRHGPRPDAVEIEAARAAMPHPLDPIEQLGEREGIELAPVRSEPNPVAPKPARPPPAKRTAAPAADDLGLDPPKHLTRSQREAWRYAVANAPKGILKKTDRAMLMIWVEAEDRHRIAMMMQAKLDETTELKLLIRTPQGLAPSPYIDILARTARTMVRFAQELGFSPAARARLKSPGPEPERLPADSPWAQLRLIPGGRKEDPSKPGPGAA
jgi:P27 family predicted phage terminase small subunit